MSIFSTSPGKITDFSNMNVGDIFNQSVVPRANSLESILQQSIADYDAATVARQARSQETDMLLSSPQDDGLVAPSPVFAPPAALGNMPTVDENYDAPIKSSSLPAAKSNSSMKIKLSNYGYNSDSSPDYNSNVLKIGNHNNKLEDGVSAALTASLAKKHGLQVGQMFEVETADGKTMKRRYDDTVPTTYKGKPLPETVDLYERKGSNKFGGTVVAIRPLK